MAVKTKARSKRHQVAKMRIGGSLFDPILYPIYNDGIPNFNKNGYLPRGIHVEEHWDKFNQRFGWNEQRQQVLQKLHYLASVLGVAGCHALYVGGSFVTTKEDPQDFDVVWEHDAYAAVRFSDFTQEELVYLLHKTQAQRAKYWGGDVWLKGEFVYGVGFPWTLKPYPTNVRALEMICHNDRVSPPQEVGVVRLNPWRLNGGRSRLERTA